MHQYFADTFNGLEAGIRLEERSILDVGATKAPAATPTKTKTVKIEDRHKTVPPAPTPSTSVHAKVREAIKDGQISAKEKTAFDKSPSMRHENASEQKRLRDAVAKADGSPTAKPVYDEMNSSGGATVPITEHQKRITALKTSKDGNADKIQARIDGLKADGVPESDLKPFTKLKDARLADERKVADVVANKAALVGSLEAEKSQLGASTAEKTHQQDLLRDEAQPHLEQFIKHQGKTRETDWVGDDWDTPATKDPDKLFNDLARQFKKDPKLLDQWVGHQGNSNNEVTNWDAHLERQSDPKEAVAIAGRRDAARELAPILKSYVELDASADAGRVKEIDAEIEATNKSIKDDSSVLSSESRKALEALVVETPGIIDDAPSESGGSLKWHDISNSSDEQDGSSSTITDSPGERQGIPAEQSGTTKPIEDSPGERKGLTVETPPASETQTTTRTERIDYSLPKNRDKVIAQATKRNLLPAEHTSFDKHGNAVYSVQKGDSYWRIADMSDGKPAGQTDLAHFSKAVKVNSARLGRDPQVGMLYVSDKVVIPNRNLNDLIKLLNLPTTREVQVEVDLKDESVHGQIK